MKALAGVQSDGAVSAANEKETAWGDPNADGLPCLTGPRDPVQASERLARFTASWLDTVFAELRPTLRFLNGFSALAPKPPILIRFA